MNLNQKRTHFYFLAAMLFLLQSAHAQIVLLPWFQFTYTITNGDVTITGCNYPAGPNELDIPDVFMVPPVTANPLELPVTSVGSEAFFESTNISVLTFGTNLTDIGDYAFGECVNLTNVTFPSNIRRIGKGAFSYTGLSGVSLGTNVTCMGDAVFYGCQNLASIAIPASVTNFGANSFGSCRSLADVMIANGARTIGDFAFSNCDHLNGITIPDSVTNLGISVFDNCTSLSRVTISKCVTDIKINTFFACTNLANITIPKAVNSLDDGVFAECSGLNGVFFEGDAPVTVGADVFRDDSTTVYYQTGAKGWSSTFAGMPTVAVNRVAQGNLFFTSPTNGQVWNIGPFLLTGTASPSTYTNCLTGNIIPGTSISRVWFQVNSNGWQLASTTNNWTRWSAEANLEPGTNVLQAYAEDAFGKSSTNTCAGIVEVPYPYSITISNGAITISAYAGDGAVVIIPDKINGMPVTCIGANAFYYCTNLTNLTIGSNVTSIESKAFYECESLASVNIPNNVISIGKYAFTFCSSLTSFNFPNVVTNIGDYIFLECYSLTNVTIGDHVSSIGAYAFAGCSSLSSLTFPETLSTIGDGAFNVCTNLTGIYFKGNAPVNVNYGVAYEDSRLTIYFLPGTTGWTGKIAFEDIPMVQYPLLLATEPLYFDLQTGLFYENVIVQNPSSAIVTGLRFTVMNLYDFSLNGNSVYLVSATGTNAYGEAYVEYSGSLLPHSTNLFTLAYYSPIRKAPTGVSLLLLAGISSSETNLSGATVAVKPPYKRADGKLAFEFSTLTGRSYAVEYSSNMVAWKRAQALVPGTGSAVIWVDAGPPDTDPVSGSRFYKVILLPP